MYKDINTRNDVLKEKYIYNSELTDIGFPKIVPPELYELSGIEKMKPVPFNLAMKEMKPRESICHFFIDDYQFERLWNNFERYKEFLQNFKFVIAPDFSMAGDMPFMLQLYQVYRNRAMAHYFILQGINVIPSCNWSNEESFGFCFNGLPIDSVIAITTNARRNTETERKMFLKGFEEMKRRLSPKKIICVGKPIPGMEDEENIIYFDSYEMKNGE